MRALALLLLAVSVRAGEPAPEAPATLGGARVREVRAASVLLLGSDGAEKETFLAPGASVRRDGKPADWGDVQEGDHVIGAIIDGGGRIKILQLASEDGAAEKPKQSAASGPVTAPAAARRAAGWTVKEIRHGEHILAAVSETGKTLEFRVDGFARVERDGAEIVWEDIAEGDGIQEVHGDGDKAVLRLLSPEKQKAAVEERKLRPTRGSSSAPRRTRAVKAIGTVIAEPGGPSKPAPAKP